MSIRAQLITCAAIAMAVLYCDATNAQAADSVDQRRTVWLEHEAAHPFPSSHCLTPRKASDSCITGELSQALALLYLNRTPDDLSRGNAFVADALARIPALQGFGSPNGLRTINLDEFHFGPSVLLDRIASQFGTRRGPFSNRLDHRLSDEIARIRR